MIKRIVIGVTTLATAGSFLVADFSTNLFRHTHKVAVPVVKYSDVPRQYSALTTLQKNIVSVGMDNGPRSGYRYVWGAAYPPYFDCSGFVYYTLRRAGYYINARTSFGMWHNGGYLVPNDLPRPGDIAFYKSYGSWTNPGHVALYVGKGQVVEYFRTGYPARQRYYKTHDLVGLKRWWHPMRVPSRIYKKTIYVAKKWSTIVKQDYRYTVMFVPNGNKRFTKVKRASLVRWAHSHGYGTTGNMTYIKIKLIYSATIYKEWLRKNV